MPIIKSVRNLFSRRAPIELNVSAPPMAGDPGEVLLDDPPAAAPAEADSTTPSDEAHAALQRLEQPSEEAQAATEAMAIAAEHLPKANNTLHSIEHRQHAIQELLRGLLETERNRAESDQEAAGKLHAVLKTHADTMGLVQQQLDLNHQVSSTTAERLQDLAQGLAESANGTRQTGKAVHALVNEIKQQNLLQEERMGILQGWIIACVIACIATVIAGITLAIVALSS